MKKEEVFDVVIIGGGPAGLSAAISLLQKISLSVLVVEGQVPGEERIGESCPPETVLLLKQLGVAPAFYRGGHETCPGYASVWGREVVGYNDFIVNPHGSSWRLNRKGFDRMLAEAAQDLGAQVRWNTRFLDAEKSLEEDYILRIREGNSNFEYQVKSRFVIDASGPTARFARSIGIHKKVEDKLFASVQFASLVSGKASKQIQLEAVADGWWYSTLLPENRMVTMMVTEQEHLKVLREEQHRVFEKQLAATQFLSKRLEKLSLTDRQYFTRPIFSGILPVMEGENWMAIGDAASSYDPVAAQGIYKGLSDGLRSTAKLLAFFDRGSYRENSFSEGVQQRYNQYLKNRAHVYALEGRWLSEPFWKNRFASMERRVRETTT